MPMVKVVTYVDVGPWHVKGEKRRFLKSKNNKQNSESMEVLLSLHVESREMSSEPAGMNCTVTAEDGDGLL